MTKKINIVKTGKDISIRDNNLKITKTKPTTPKPKK
jgi:hypothetical protein